MTQYRTKVYFFPIRTKKNNIFLQKKIETRKLCFIFTAESCNELIRLSEFVSVNIKRKGGFGLYIVANWQLGTGKHKEPDS